MPLFRRLSATYSVQHDVSAQIARTSAEEQFVVDSVAMDEPFEVEQHRPVESSYITLRQICFPIVLLELYE
jgi:hypothetical protein